MEKQPLDEFKDCKADLLCRNCRPRLRRLEFEVNEMKLVNAFLKECFHGCEIQKKDADENLSGALSSRSRPIMNTSPTCFSNSKLSSNDQIYESSSPTSKAMVDLQEKLIESMKQYCLLVHKYNEMVGQFQRCQDALLCWFKYTYELEKVNQELQIQLKEILQIEHSSHETIVAQKVGVNQEFASPSMGATLQRLIKESSGQVDALNASMPSCIHEEPVAAAACIGSAVSDYQRNMMSMCCTKSHNGTLLPSNYYVSPPGLLNHRETSLTSVPCVKMKAQAGDMALPYNQPVHSDGTHLPHFAVPASQSSQKSALSMLSLKNAATMESTPKKQQSSRQINTPLSEVISPSDRFRLKSRSPSGTNENDTYISQANHSPVSSFPNACLVSPIACKQLHDEHGSTVINVPKIISIRANPQGGHLNCSNDQNIPDGPAHDTACTLSSLDLNKSHCHRHHSAPIRNEAEKQMKVVVLAKNMECMAFPQGAYKTEMCNKWVKSMGQYCPYKDKCQFAHGPHELRPVLRHCRYKSILCRMVAAGEVCPYEHRCHFRHVIYPHEAELLSLN